MRTRGLAMVYFFKTQNQKISLPFLSVSSRIPQEWSQPRISRHPESEAPVLGSRSGLPHTDISSPTPLSTLHQLFLYPETPSLISRGWRVRRPTICHTMSGIFRFLWVTKNVHVTFSLNVLCFPFTIGKVKITVFHLLVACTFVFTYLWGYVIYNTLIKDNQVRRLNSEN